MKIIKADQLFPLSYTRQDVVEAFCVKLMNKIKEGHSRGCRKILFEVPGGYYSEHNKMITHKDNGGQYHNWNDYKRDVEKVFVAAGYVVKSTGYVDGVWQRTKSIMW